MTAALTCAREDRRALVRERGWNGIDYVEVDDSTAQPRLCIHFFGKIPSGLGTAQLRIEGGRRIRNLRVLGVTVEDDADDPDHEGCLRVVLDRVGDFSPYRVRVLGLDARGKATTTPPSGFDPRYASAEFRFRLGCPATIDCTPDRPDCPPPNDGVPIDYLAKDYASFRRAVLDRLAVAMPDWTERHIPDIGITLVELLAYVGDYLSYYQDAVATEAYLATARRRVSVRRHARLVDYALHEGCNARAWLVLTPEVDDVPNLDLRQLYFVTASDALAGLPSGVVSAEALAPIPRAEYQCFQPLHLTGASITLRRALAELQFYTWGDTECTLCRGATRATLVRTWSDDQRWLAPGDVLLLEEVKGPSTGEEADADPEHRWFVRLIEATMTRDELTDTAVLEIAWSADDALPFDLTLSTLLPAPSCTRVEGLCVARGNVILVDHGATFVDDSVTVGTVEVLGTCACPGSLVDRGLVPERVSLPLQQPSPLFREALPQAALAASKLLTQDPRAALPIVKLYATDPAVHPDAPPLTHVWHPVADLLASGPSDRRFVVEIDEDRSARLRFGDGDCGAQPQAGVRLRAHYQAGEPLAGNVEAETITRIVAPTQFSAAIGVRNPLRAQGGTAPEALADAKLAIPHAWKRQLKRAITGDDYAQLAAADARLQRAAAELEWTGSWYEARVSIDPRNAEAPTAALIDEVQGELAPYRRLGHDLRTLAAKYVPLALALSVCVKPGFLRAHVLSDILARLGDKALPDGSLGFFHPDALTFGQAICASAIIARVQQITGVESVLLTTLRRLDGHEEPQLPADGMLALKPDEIAQLDSDRDFPELGQLEITIGGGR